MMTVNLNEFGQDHLFQFSSELNPAEQATLNQQIDDIDFTQLSKLIASEDEQIDWAALAQRASAPPAVLIDEPNPRFSPQDARNAGEAALRGGKVGLILVAGGQGTRLGFDKPKGLFPVGPLSERTLFEMHCDRLLAIMDRYGVEIPMFVMTSPATDGPTREYFDANDRCGLSESQLRVFCQGTMPAVDDKTGQILMASKSELALSPDGHGGLVPALDKNGCLEEARAAGIDYFFYAQVDNPLAQLCDPELIGYHILAESQMTTQVVRKRFAKEKVGNVVTVDGKVQIIEYSDLPDEYAEQTDDAGTLKLWAGNIAVHVFDRAFLSDVVSNVEGLPFHRAHKKVAYVNAEGELVKPEEPNAIKFERFVFDLLPLAKNAIVVEGDPAKVFAPVKNADGAPVDTPEHTKQALLTMHRQWLQAAGAKIPDTVRVEIHPAWALDAEQVASRLTDPIQFEADTYLR